MLAPTVIKTLVWIILAHYIKIYKETKKNLTWAVLEKKQHQTEYY